jgi:hypothetical protein
VSWRTVQHGWVVKRPREETIARAKALRAERDAQGVPSIFLEQNDHRWVGDLAELGFQSWLMENDLEHIRHGGVDQLPDFVVGGFGVGLKCRTSTYSMRPDYIVNVPTAHLHRSAETLLFFAAYEVVPNRLVLLGVIGRPRFDAESFDSSKGAALHRGRPAAAAPCRNVHVHALAPPDQFLRRLRLP